MAETVAAIDCGTNSTRLLIADVEPGGGRAATTLDRRMTITRLGRGVDAGGRLSPEAMERTLDVLRGYREAMDAAGVTRVLATATSAVRDASNRDELLDPAEELLGVRPVTLTGDQEARLSFAGATAELDPSMGPFLVVDIGGGSTEFVVGTDEVQGALSVDVGCVRISERYLEHDPPLPEELSSAQSVISLHIDDVIREVPAVTEARTLVGLAGTVSTAAAVEQGLDAYDRDRIHHFVLSRSAAEEVFRTLATEPLADRVHNPGLERERADVIVGGLNVLVMVFRRFGFKAMLVSESDILDGLVASLARGEVIGGA